MNNKNRVLLIHGIDDTEALFYRMRPYLESCGRVVHCLNLTPNNGAAGLEVLARQIAAYVETTFGKGELFDMVGFSMGGLVARYYIQRLGGLQRVRRFITISSPHNGTCVAFLRRNEGARQMRKRFPSRSQSRRSRTGTHRLHIDLDAFRFDDSSGQ